MLKSPGDVVKPDAPHAAEYALCRRYDPLEGMAWQGSDMGVVRKLLVLQGEVLPAWKRLGSGSADAASATALSEGARKAGLHDLALFSRQLRVALNLGYEKADVDFIAEGLRALVPGPATERTIARLSGDPSPIHSVARFE